MRMIGDVKAYTLEECLDEEFGPIGTPRRDAFEKKVADDIRRDEAREARREARKAKLQTACKTPHWGLLLHDVTPIVNAINKVSDGQPQVVRP